MRRAGADEQDWHVDFAASSVYYHIHTGAKEFYFIRPTEQNLKAYATWSGSAELQQREWLGDMCEGGVEKVRLLAGDTMFIPAGYIHAVVSSRSTLLTGTISGWVALYASCLLAGTANSN